jgi:hypothetical protein
VSVWRPLLGGAARRRALEAVRDIGEDLRRRRGPGPLDAACDRSLGEGDAGVAVFLAYLGDVDARWRRTARARLGRAVRGVAAAGMGPSLQLGFTGVAWALEHLAPRLGVDAGATDGVDDAVAAHLRRPDALPGAGLAFGAAGLALWALEPRRGPSAALAGAVVRRLARAAEPAGDRTVAAGQAGVVLALARLVEAGQGGPRARPLLARATRRLLAAPGEAMPPWWLKGELGVAIALLVAGRVLDDDAARARGMALALRVAAADPEGCVAASLGRGAAGVAHGLARLAVASGDDRLARGAAAWGERVLALRRPGEGVGGYRVPDVASAVADRPGVLLGAAGVGLALLALATDVEPAWDRMLGGAA